MTEYTAQEKAEYIKQKVNDMTKNLEDKLKDIYNGNGYKEWLSMINKFPNYSLNNQILIMCQKPEATNVCSFTNWKKLGRSINKGAKGIQILAPQQIKYNTLETKTDEFGQYILDENGKKIQEEVTKEYLSFKPVTVFDISDTNGKELPRLGIDELRGDVNKYPDIIKALKEISPVPISFENIDGPTKGYFSSSNQNIVINEGMSELQTLKTVCHEVAHSILHNQEKEILHGLNTSINSRSDKEIQAESVAYVICEHLGVDTSDYSLGYVAGWSSNHHDFVNKEAEIEAFRQSLDAIRDCSSYIINKLDEKLLVPDKEIQKDADISKSKEEIKLSSLTINQQNILNKLNHQRNNKSISMDR